MSNFTSFLVRQTRKHIRQTRSAEDDDIDFFVLNPHPQTGSVLPFVIASTDLPVIPASHRCCQGLAHRNLQHRAG